MPLRMLARLLWIQIRLLWLWHDFDLDGLQHRMRLAAEVGHLKAPVDLHPCIRRNGIIPCDRQADSSRIGHAAANGEAGNEKLVFVKGVIAVDKADDFGLLS